MAKKVLITGGAGFIGSHLCRKNLTMGNEVICLDNFYTGSKENIYDLIDHNNFSILNHDIIKPFSLEVDTIYNLACPASPIHYQKDPIKTMKTNILGSINLLELADKTGARILQASTSEIYGNPYIHPQREDYWGHVNPIGIRSCYDEGKRASESLFFDYHRKRNTNIKVVRIFNTYGPHIQINDGRVVSNFIVQALKGQDITIYGTGNQTRSFCYIDDLIDGLIKMMDAKDFTGPVNMGNPNEITILDLAQRIIELTGSKSKLVFKDLPQDDPIKRKPDISLAKEVLAWEPKISLNRGLKNTIKYFKAYYNFLFVS